MTDTNWYSSGIRFECIGCGECCKDHGEYTYIYLIKEDIEAVSACLEMVPDLFLDKYCEIDDGLAWLKMEGPACPFLKEGKCVVYHVRPLQCKTWPFWRENLKKESWETEVLPFCPGIGKGKCYTAEEIERIAESVEEGFEEYIS